MHIVGTPRRIVVLVAVIRARVPSPSNRRSTAIEPPRNSVESTPVTSPRTCENGAAPRTTSSGPKAIASAAAPAAVAMLPCVSTAPFGLPDVPDVKRMTAGSAVRGGSPRPSSAPTRRLRPTHRRPARRLPAQPGRRFRRGEERVEGNRNRADPPDREQHRDEPGLVREEERNAVVAGNARARSTASANRDRARSSS